MPGQGALMVVGIGALALAWIRPIPAVAGEPEVGKGCERECPSTAFASRQIPLNKLQSYENITCRGKTSVILTTKQNRIFCARPEDSWVQSVMRQLDAKNAPPPSKVSTPVPEKPGWFDKHSKDAVPTSALAVGHAHPTGTVTYRTSTEFPGRRTRAPDYSEVNATPVGPETVSASSESTTKTEEAGIGATFKPESVANGNTVSPTSDRPTKFGEDLILGGEDQTPDSGTAHDLVTSSTVIGTQSTTYSRFDTQNPMRSSVQPTFHLSSSPLSRFITYSVEKGMIPSTISLTSPSMLTSVLSTASRLQTTAGPTNLLPRKDVPDWSSTHSSIVGSSTRSINMKDRSDAVSNSSVAFGGTSRTPSLTGASNNVFSEPPFSQPTSGFHQENVSEKSRAQATIYTPEVTLTLFPGVLAGYRTHIISLVCASVLFIASAVVGWVWLRSSLSATTSPKEMVEGLLHKSLSSQADEYALQIL